jgi:hypothetical protein
MYKIQILTKQSWTTLFAMVVILFGCAETSTIQPAATSKSQFEDAVYGGESVTVSESTSGVEEFRVFHQGATGFVSIQSVRYDAEQRASEFCDRKGKAMNVLQETTSKPPYILGNFPRVELIFNCVEKTIFTKPPVTDDSKYEKLFMIKKLLDSGVLTQEEFEQEKAKILSQP